MKPLRCLLQTGGISALIAVPGSVKHIERQVPLNRSELLSELEMHAALLADFGLYVALSVYQPNNADS